MSTPVLAALAVAAVLLVAFAASGFFVDGVGVAAWRQVDEESQVETAERAAPAAAERAAAAILSYSHESLEADRDNAARFMTDSYRKEYLDTFGLVLDNAPEVKAVVEAEVRASGVVHADPGRANVLLFVNQTTTSTANEGEPQTALNRVMLTMAAARRHLARGRHHVVLTGSARRVPGRAARRVRRANRDEPRRTAIAAGWGAGP